MEEIINVLPDNIAGMMQRIPAYKLADIQEIRLRINRPVFIRVGNEEYGLNEKGLTKYDGIHFTAEDASRLWRKLSSHSPYALIESQKNGYITLNGGHRVGICGEALSDGNGIRHFTNITAYCIRCAKEYIGTSLKVIDSLLDGSTLYNTLIVSPPACGKTTLLRDLARNLSNRGFNTAIIDERNELSACVNGIPTLDVGSRTDVYTGCKKAYAMESMLRSMAPDVIITDEISGESDTAAITEIIKAGITLIASSHGNCIQNVLDRPSFSVIKNEKIFQRYVLLKNRSEIGQIENIYDADLNTLQSRGVKRCCL